MAVWTGKVLEAHRFGRVSVVRSDRSVLDADLHDGTVRVPRATVRRRRSAAASRPLRAAAADRLQLDVDDGRRALDSGSPRRRRLVRVLGPPGDGGLSANCGVTSVTTGHHRSVGVCRCRIYCISCTSRSPVQLLVRSNGGTSRLRRGSAWRYIPRV